MRIGGVLELTGAEHYFTRTKQRSNSLLNARDSRSAKWRSLPISPACPATPTGPCFRWTTRRWRQAENRYSSSRGDLGRLLFTASAGLEHASDTLNALEAEADRSIASRHTEPNWLLKKRLAELKSRRMRWTHLRRPSRPLKPNVSTRRNNTTRTISERAVLAARLDTIAAIAGAIPILADIRRKTARLARAAGHRFAGTNLDWQRCRADRGRCQPENAAVRQHCRCRSPDRKNRIGEVDDADPCDVGADSRTGGTQGARTPRPALTCPTAGWSCKSLDNAVATSLGSAGTILGAGSRRACFCRRATVGVVRTWSSSAPASPPACAPRAMRPRRRLTRCRRQASGLAKKERCPRLPGQG